MAMEVAHTCKPGCTGACGCKRKLQFNDQQRLVLQNYDNGEFSYLLDDPAALGNCGDTLLIFMIKELADQEGCDSMTEAYNRVCSAARQLTEIASILGRAIS
jgi:hypothetical protein